MRGKVEHETEKADVLLWQHHLEEHFSGNWDEQPKCLSFLFTILHFLRKVMFYRNQ